MSPRIPLNELTAAVQSAVTQVFSKHGVVTIYKLWVRFVAPDLIATAENAGKIAHELGKEAGLKVTPSVGQLIEGGGGTAQAVRETRPVHRIIGLIHEFHEPKA
jgi:hypothetical protein